MEPIFNRHGRTIGWLYNGIIYDRNNCCRAFVRDGNVFTFNAQHLGIIYKGILRDRRRGQCIAYMDTASGDPMLPIPGITPVPPILSVPSATPIPPTPPEVIPVSYHWNPVKWEAYLDG